MEEFVRWRRGGETSQAEGTVEQRWEGMKSLIPSVLNLGENTTSEPLKEINFPPLWVVVLRCWVGFYWVPTMWLAALEMESPKRI